MVTVNKRGRLGYLGKHSKTGAILIDFDAEDRDIKERNERIKPRNARPLPLGRFIQGDVPHINIHRRSKYNTSDELSQRINEYFMSCHGPKLNPKTYMPITDANGNEVLIKIRPYTRSGLMIYLGICEQTFYDYLRGDLKGDGTCNAPDYANALRAGVKQIDAQAEEYLYDRDASFGAKFYLQCMPNWETRKERHETEQIKEKTKLMREEFDLKKRLAVAGEDGDSELVVQIVRKKRDESD